MNNTNQQKSYVRYTGLFNKVCASPLFLVLAILCSVYCLMNVISFFSSLSLGIFGIAFTILPCLFAVLATIGLWMMFVGAKKNQIGAGNFSLVSSLLKYTQVIKTITLIFTILGVIGVIAIIFMLKDQFPDGVNATEIKNKFGEILDFLGEDLKAIAMTAIDGLAFILNKGMILIVIAGIIIVVFKIFEIIRISQLATFLGNAKKTYKTGNMSAPPTMFYVVLAFIFGAYNLLCGFGVMPLCTFNIGDLILAAMIIIGAILILLNKDELANIYSAWQSEIGMTSAPAVEETKTDAE